MKPVNIKRNLFLSMSFLAMLTLVIACGKKFLEQDTVGLLTEAEAQSKKGAQQFLIGAYAALRGSGWEGGGMNWVYGSIVGGDANKGSDAGDQADIVPIQNYSAQPTNNYFNIKWRALYEGIARTNSTIRIANKLTNTDITPADKTQILAEARFLRAFFHFEAKKMWNMVPWVDETISVEAGNFKVPNNVDIWPKIMEDLDFARKNLVEKPSNIGRVNKWAAEAFYGKALIFQGKYTEALPVFTNVITNGKNSAGNAYALTPNFFDNFNADKEAAARVESVFAYEASINDGSGGNNANFDNVLNFPYNGGPGTCCGFFQPSFELANSFRTSAAGLPLLDGSYNVGANQLKTDQGIESNQPFTPDAGNVDPRLDWTVGRRGIPFLDWGPHPGKIWIRDQGNGGPFAPKKNAYYKSQEKVLTDGTSWTSGLTATNYKHMRFADVLLMAAECEAEVGDIEKARQYVNQVRARAANPAGFVPGAAATYVIGLYTTPFADRAAARTAVRFERKLELAMEGHRFFDVVRWGIADVALNAFLTYEKSRIPAGYSSATGFVKPKNLYFPIPQRQIDLQTTGGVSNLTQNPGY
jgi:tetratricopeptide (TPR) repeat protein